MRETNRPPQPLHHGARADAPAPCQRLQVPSHSHFSFLHTASCSPARASIRFTREHQEKPDLIPPTRPEKPSMTLPLGPTSTVLGTATRFSQSPTSRTGNFARFSRKSFETRGASAGSSMFMVTRTTRSPSSLVFANSSTAGISAMQYGQPSDHKKRTVNRPCKSRFDHVLPSRSATEKRPISRPTFSGSDCPAPPPLAIVGSTQPAASNSTVTASAPDGNSTAVKRTRSPDIFEYLSSAGYPRRHIALDDTPPRPWPVECELSSVSG